MTEQQGTDLLARVADMYAQDAEINVHVSTMQAEAAFHTLCLRCLCILVLAVSIAVCGLLRPRSS
jgi:hypothetical protein